jgi:hypothetical protein
VAPLEGRIRIPAKGQGYDYVESAPPRVLRLSEISIWSGTEQFKCPLKMLTRSGKRAQIIKRVT